MSSFLWDAAGRCPDIRVNIYRYTQAKTHKHASYDIEIKRL